MSMVGYILGEILSSLLLHLYIIYKNWDTETKNRSTTTLGLGDRHGENISFDSTNGDTVHVDFNCLFNKGESFEWPERVPFRLTHNMEAAMGPLKHEGMYR